jgi:hypothetical protein
VASAATSSSSPALTCENVAVPKSTRRACIFPAEGVLVILFRHLRRARKMARETCCRLRAKEGGLRKARKLGGAVLQDLVGDNGLQRPLFLHLPSSSSPFSRVSCSSGSGEVTLPSGTPNLLDAVKTLPWQAVTARTVNDPCCSLYGDQGTGQCDTRRCLHCTFGGASQPFSMLDPPHLSLDAHFLDLEPSMRHVFGAPTVCTKS